ncbi:ThiJ/PfpI family protein [Liquorilactobacillus sucicola DSM 21376 = JCM 15457]|uniref:PfpI family intracellular protease n=1 Tax=Liquorilactobacillus sucicola DSM 21376 = JCM 15457 TaxID=1423806 RepID=A0A023CZ09_9LACO|nr:type 1 glutamine amidotransferase domain-containing protein [Liquorilactobacillus sucicola]KRN07646.1 PfpI family intracellular protease [Liquorilactobacillus sucicola DSM 21376 = JCM 15457]GAJ26720.1 ThiJ/PfpI family protein [Liquorilactobacillus sucicola DSM 21376 = JCM 15457]
MSKIAVVVTDLVEDIEYTSPVAALEKEGHDVVTIGFEGKDSVTGKHGTKISIDKSIKEVDPADFDALLIPGGFSPDQLRSDQNFVDFTKKFLLADKNVFAICHGPQLFIQTGLVKGRTLTSYLTVQPDLYYAGALVKDAPVVIDHNLITSRTPDDLPAFNKEIVAALK